MIAAPDYGLAVVGTSLVLEGRIVGAAVAGYALVDFCQSTAIASLARQAGVPFRRLWSLAQQLQPIPQHRLAMHGELLQVLGDTILRENHRTRQYEELAARLAAESGAKDEFLAVLSHELRTPLSPILGWVSILEQQSENPAQLRKAAASIKRNALLQVRLVDDLLDLNRIVRGKVALEPGEYDLSDVLRTALDTIAETADGKGVNLEFVDSEEPLRVEGDAGRLQQIFANVLSNAVKFTPTGGSVRIVASTEADLAVVRIADTGKGIPPQFLPLVFDMFRQQEEGTRRQYSGLGIGLALVKQLVELHGGRVDIASEGEGRGTQVTLRFPISKNAHAAGEVATVRGRPFAELLILVIEDTEDSLESTRLMLEVLGAKVLVARNGIDALQVLVENEPDLILCDLRMPHMDGYEFMRELSRTQGVDHTPVIAVTGLTGLSERERTQSAGFQGHLNKPFDDRALVSAVQGSLDHRKAG